VTAADESHAAAPIPVCTIVIWTIIIGTIVLGTIIVGTIVVGRDLRHVDKIVFPAVFFSATSK
jgi:ABC-type protease/lipase transport system fused ATPase/permease subunit